MTELIAKLKEYLAEVKRLKQLDYDNQEWIEWRNEVRNWLKQFLGSNCEEVRQFRGMAVHPLTDNPNVLQRAYLDNLKAYETSLKSIIHGLELKMKKEQLEMPTLVGNLRIFIAHDGKTGARSKLEDFIRALGAEPVVVDDEAHMGRIISEKVDGEISSCHYAVALATRARASTQDDQPMARGNVINEIPRIRTSLGDRWMVALERGVNLPSNESGFIYENFAPQSMDGVFSALIRELRGHGLLKVGVANVG